MALLGGAASFGRSGRVMSAVRKWKLIEVGSPLEALNWESVREKSYGMATLPRRTCGGSGDRWPQRKRRSWPPPMADRRSLWAWPGSGSGGGGASKSSPLTSLPMAPQGAFDFEENAES